MNLKEISVGLAAKTMRAGRSGSIEHFKNWAAKVKKMSPNRINAALSGGNKGTDLARSAAHIPGRPNNERITSALVTGLPDVRGGSVAVGGAITGPGSRQRYGVSANQASDRELVERPLRDRATLYTAMQGHERGYDPATASLLKRYQDSVAKGHFVPTKIPKRTKGQSMVDYVPIRFGESSFMNTNQAFMEANKISEIVIPGVAKAAAGRIKPLPPARIVGNFVRQMQANGRFKTRHLDSIHPKELAHMNIRTSDTNEVYANLSEGLWGDAKKAVGDAADVVKHHAGEISTAHHDLGGGSTVSKVGRWGKRMVGAVKGAAKTGVNYLKVHPKVNHLAHAAVNMMASNRSTNECYANLRG